MRAAPATWSRATTFAPGDSTTVTFHVGADDLGFWTNDQAGTFTVEPGRFDLCTGTSSETESRGTLRVVPD
ncbi:fibronectin type III-like domain-contianing protein [Streptomyces sp. NPDC055092]